MKKLYILFILPLALFLLTAGCSNTTGNTDESNQSENVNTVVCNAPYIKVRDRCCLDQNQNGICDRLENTVPSQSPDTPPSVSPQPSPVPTPDPSSPLLTGLPLGAATFSDSCDCGRTTSVDAEPGTITTCTCATISGCQGIADTTVRLKITEPTTNVKGTVILGTGGGGGAFYESFGEPAIDEVILPLVRSGFRVIQRGWYGTNGWMTGPGGASKLACRYSTLIDGIYKDFHSEGPFCVSGNSGGSAEISYSLAHYGMGRIIDLAVPTAGPPLGRLDYGCLGSTHPTWSQQCTAQQDCEFNGLALGLIDGTYGSGSTDCENRNPAMEYTWRDDSVLSPFAILNYPQTEVRFIFGDEDGSEAVTFGELYYDAITSSKKITTVSGGVPHAVPSVDAGAEQVYSDLSEGCVLRH